LGLLDHCRSSLLVRICGGGIGILGGGPERLELLFDGRGVGSGVEVAVLEVEVDEDEMTILEPDVGVEKTAGEWTVVDVDGPASSGRGPRVLFCPPILAPALPATTEEPGPIKLGGLNESPILRGPRPRASGAFNESELPALVLTRVSRPRSLPPAYAAPETACIELLGLRLPSGLFPVPDTREVDLDRSPPGVRD
jgi:hypothetical protein